MMSKQTQTVFSGVLIAQETVGEGGGEEGGQRKREKEKN